MSPGYEYGVPLSIYGRALARKVSRVTTPLARLAELGVQLPPVAVPLAAYVPAARSGSLVYTAGQLPFVDGALPVTGKVGEDVSMDDAAKLARTCAINGLAAIDSLVGLDAVAQVVKVVGYVASSPQFTDQPLVINGASELLRDVFGDAGQHARSAVGVAALPLDAPVEVELVVEVR
jgi:enamine deaminase RidA (YjgF/YER057c/UK114 family)